MLTKIILENFMNIEFAEIEGKEGINAYIGNNGQGKSAVFEAVAFVFLDRKKGDTFKDYIRIGEKSARIQLEWYIGDDLCFFDYEISKSSGGVSRSITFGDDDPITSSEDCQKFLKEHFDLKMLKDIVFNLQDSDAITQMIPSDRREVMQKVFNVDFVIGLIQLKKDMDSVSDQLKLVSARKQALSEKTYPYMRIEKIENEDKLPEWKVEKAELEKKLIKVGDVTELTAQISGQDTLVVQFTSQITENADSTDLKSKTLSAAIHDLSRQTTEVEEHRQSKIRISEELDALNKDRKLIHPVPPEVIANLEKEIANCRGELSFKEIQLVMYRKAICDSCGQKCDPKYTGELESEVAALQEQMGDMIKALDETKETKEILADFDKKISEKTSELKVITERVIGCEKLLESLEIEKTRLEETLVELKKKGRELLKQKTKAEDILASYKLELIKKQEELKKLEPIKLRISELEGSIKLIEAKQIANEERKQVNAQLEKQEQADKQEIEQKTIEEKDFNHQIALLKQAKTILETILPDFIIAQGCVILETFINKFIASTGSDLLVRLVAESSSKRSKGVQFYYFSHTTGKEELFQTGEWLPVVMASGYETALLTLSFKLAIAFMYQSDILLLDEPDKTATEENSLLLFKHIANLEGFRQIFIISHREALKEWLKNEADAFVYEVENGVFEEAV